MASSTPLFVCGIGWEGCVTTGNTKFVGVAGTTAVTFGGLGNGTLLLLLLGTVICCTCRLVGKAEGACWRLLLV